MAATCRVFLADDHPLLREAVRDTLAMRPEFNVTGEAGDAVELLKLLDEGGAPDVLILDLSMPGLQGLWALQEVRKRDLDVRILVLTMHDEEELLSQVFRAGADGYLLKHEITEELFVALDTVLRDEIYVSPSLVRDVRDSWLNVFIASKGIPCGEALSTWQVRLLRLLAKGASKEEIARSLGISTLAVDHHRARIMEKLDIDEPGKLVRYAITMGYTENNHSASL
jgi:two-component system, NarL family, response regulator NreC